MSYFSSYLISKEDLSQIISIAERVYISGLFDLSTLTGLRIITFDSKSVFAVSKEAHKAKKDIRVEELNFSHPRGGSFRVFTFPTVKVKSRLDEDIFRCATTWFEKESLIETAVDSNLVAGSVIPGGGKSKILKTIFVPPPEPFNKIHKGAFDYEIDVVFHEVAHVEDTLVRKWFNRGEFDYKIDAVFHDEVGKVDRRQKGAVSLGSGNPFSSQKKEEPFFDLVARSGHLSEEALSSFRKFIDKATVGELYAFIVDREAARMFKPDFARKKDREFDKILTSINKISLQSVSNFNLRFRSLSSYEKALILVGVVEKLLPDFYNRKMWFRRVFKR